MPLFQSFESFYTRNVYRRIRDAWNRPIGSVPGAELELVDRETTDNGWTFRFTGTKTKALNLGSYNYLGFAENKGECAKAAMEATKKYGVGVCSTRHELGMHYGYPTVDLSIEVVEKRRSFSFFLTGL